MENFFIGLSIVEFAAMSAMFVGLRHRDRKIREEMDLAITFALDVRPVWKARQFLQAFRDGDTHVLDKEFPEWNAFRNDEPYGVEAI
jgi:hypothetical protein